jgi:hypothetical protein
MKEYASLLSLFSGKNTGKNTGKKNLTEDAGRGKERAFIRAKIFFFASHHWQEKGPTSPFWGGRPNK